MSAANTSAERFDAWGIVELMGHQRVAGRITEQQVGGTNFVRVDIPKPDGEFFTRLFGGSAIYAINITGEKEARLAAEYSLAHRPPFAWEIEQQSRNPALAGPSSEELDRDADTDPDPENDDAEVPL